MDERKIFLRFLARLSGGVFLYALVLALSIKLSRFVPEGMERTALLLICLLPLLLLTKVAVRQVRRVDEYLRLLMLENIALAAGITTGWTFIYGFLESAGFPRLSMFTVGAVMGAVWAVVAVVRHRVGR
jgi:hypothetical protein